MNSRKMLLWSLVFGFLLIPGCAGSSSEDPNAYFNQGLANAEAGDFGLAIENYTKAIELDPDLAEAYNDRGLAKANLGDLEQALVDFDQAIELDPDYAEGLHQSGGGPLPLR